MSKLSMEHLVPFSKRFFGDAHGLLHDADMPGESSVPGNGGTARTSPYSHSYYGGLVLDVESQGIETSSEVVFLAVLAWARAGRLGRIDPAPARFEFDFGLGQSAAFHRLFWPRRHGHHGAGPEPPPGRGDPGRDPAGRRVGNPPRLYWPRSRYF